MILTTTETVPGREIACWVGLAKGCSVRGAHAGDDLVAGMKNALGGEVHEYTRVLAQTREQALDRMIEDARRLGADAVVGVRLCSSEIGDGVAELVAYGTAVKLKAN
ncbi:MAG: YbjQ family protein [Candidatus Sumerlaeia bacterium]|nr:YbjQ family protein [Candidatus Sumerlaeia bacterium]